MRGGGADASAAGVGCDGIAGAGGVGNDMYCASGSVCIVM